MEKISIKNSIENSYNHTIRLKMLILLSCIIIAVGIYGWNYQTSIYREKEKELQSYNASLVKALAIAEQLNTHFRRWDNGYDIEQETLANTQLKEFESLTKYMVNDYPLLSGTLEKNIAYWEAASDYALRINILNSEANRSFYSFIALLDKDKQAKKLLPIISRLLLKHHLFFTEVSENSYAVIERDIRELIKIVPSLKNKFEKYLGIIENTLLQTTKVLPIIIELQTTRYSTEYDFNTVTNVFTEQNKIQQQQLQNQQKNLNNILYLSLIFWGCFIFWRVSLSANLILKENKIIARSNFYLNEKLKVSQLNEHIKTNFLSVISYESRTNLDVIIGLTRFANEKSESLDQKAKLTQVITSSEHLTLLLNDVMELIDFDMDKVILEKVAFSPKKVIELITNKYQQKAEVKNIIFECAIDQTISDVYIGDPKRFYQLIDYLLSNAFTYTETGHVSLTIDADSGKNLLNYMQRINFQLEDTGIQSPPEEIGVLFKPFAMTNFSSSRKSGVAGVHLSMVNYLLKLMGGDIEATVPAYKGMKYNFHLNLGIDELEQSPVAIDSLIESTKPKDGLVVQMLKVLIVEDNAINASLLKWILEGQKHEVTIAKNGIECINIIENNDFDIIFMDQYMPEMGGVEATEKIRAYDNYKSSTPIIGCTADASQETRDLLLSVGQNDVINKPISNDVISKVTHNLLRGKYTQQLGAV